MNDTHPQITAKFKKLMNNKTNVQRLFMGCSMYDMAKQLVISSILQRFPAATDDIIRREIFIRFYGDEFDLESKEKIIKHLMPKTKKP
jgi:hypothetical protein